MNTIFRFLIPLLLISSAAAEDPQPTAQPATRPILLVTPKGVWEAVVLDGVPGPWKATDLDVIVQGFSVGSPPSGPVPDPPPTNPVDPLVTSVATMSKAVLKDKSEATAVAALIEALQKANISPESFKESLEMALRIADSSMKTDGRLIKWRIEVLKITEDPAKMKAGVQEAFGISSVSLGQITAAAYDDNYQPADEALDVVQIIQLIQLILDLLRNLGII